MLSIAPPPCDAGILRGAPATPGCASHAKRWVLATTILGSSLAFIAASVINVALPAVQHTLRASVGEMQWIASIYTLFVASLTLTTGSAGDRFGRVHVFALGLGILAVASVAAGCVATGTQLVIARAVQGIGAALLVPNSLALLSAAFPRSERGRAIGTWSAATAVTSAAGPVVGGVLVDTTSWRAAFVLLAPLALVTLGIALARVPEVRIGRQRPEIDWWGVVLAIGGLAVLVFGLIALADGPSALATVGCGLALLGGFVWHETRTPSPMMPPRLFRSATFLGANLLTLLLYFAISGAFFLLPFDLVRIHHYSATATGAVYLPFAVLLGGLSTAVGGHADRVGARVLLVTGPLVVAAGLLLLAVAGTSGSYWTTFFPAMATIGLGMALTVAPLTSTIMGSVDESDVGVASGVNNTVARVAGLVAIAVVGLVALTIFSRELAARLPALDLSPAVAGALAAQHASLGDVSVPPGVTAAEGVAIAQAAATAFVTAFRWVAVLMAVLAAAGGLIAAVTIEGRPARTPAAPGTTEPICAHLELVRDVAPLTEGCAECLQVGKRWVHLRLCLACGHVGCCDSSGGRHATAHFWATSHPVVGSLEPGETWRWCYVDEIPL